MQIKDLCVKNILNFNFMDINSQKIDQIKN